MKRLIILLAVLTATSVPDVAIARSGSYATMHNEKESPRPAGVMIAGAKPDQVVLYCTTLSAGCKGMREHLTKRGIDYLDKELTTDSVAQAEFAALGGEGVPLMVFKDRLLHGYYPTGFERVYAKQTSGQPAQRAVNAAAGQGSAPYGDKPSLPAATSSVAATIPNSAGEVVAPTAALAPGNPALSPRRGAMIEDIAPDAIKAYVSRHPYVAVLYTSPDSTCPPCVETQPDFEKAAARGLSAIRYARVQWSPWHQTPAAVKPMFDKAYLPAINVYLRGKAVAHQAGGVDADRLNAYMEKRFGFAP